jgi:UDP-N-acetylglucosamine 2-epimerase
VANLKAEGITKGVSLTGDLMYEQLYDSRTQIARNRSILSKLGLQRKAYCLLTAHRAGNVDDSTRLARLVDLIAAIDLPVLFPLHPRTKSRLREFKLTKRFESLDNLIAVAPLNYLDLLTAAKYARRVLTDSGGLQKEALFLGTPVLTLRAETEWVETIGKGNHLVDLDARRVSNLLSRDLKTKPIDYRIRDRKSGQALRPSNMMTEQILRYPGVKK